MEPNGQAPTPNPDDAAEYIRNIARQVADESAAAFREYLVKEVLPTFPKQVDIVRDVVATVSAKVSQEVAEFGKRMDRLEGLLTQPTSPTQATQRSSTGGQPPAEINIPGVGKPVDLGGWMALVDYGLKTFLQLQEARIRMTDPFTLAAKIREIDPVKAAIAGQLLYPNPMEQYAPALAAQVGANAFRQGMNLWVPMLREGMKKGTWQPHDTSAPTGSTPSGGFPSWYGGPNSPGVGPRGAPPGQDGASPAWSATMSGSQNEQGPRGSGQDTVRVSRRQKSGSGSERALAPTLRGNFQ